MAGAAVVAAVFAATPLLLPDVSTGLNVPLGTTGMLSAAQVGSFALASLVAGRLYRPRRRFHYGSLGLVAVASIGSALAPNFVVLMASRVLAGVGLGTLTWIAWADATRFARGMGDVAAVAPLTATLASPPLGWITEHLGFRWVFASMAVVALLAMLLSVDFGELPRVGRSVSASLSNRFLLLGLMALTLGGSSVFVFTGAAAQELHGLTPGSVAWAFSMNAIAGVAATRRHARAGSAWAWLVATSASALLVGITRSGLIFFFALTIWGFAFWMAVPAIFRLIEKKALTPVERVGDAQAIMAVGRVFGPLVGGVALAGGEFGRLSITGGAVVLLAAAIVAVVELGRARGWSSRSVSQAR
jgi:predicted MFS family arabinose efflux permease